MTLACTVMALGVSHSNGEGQLAGAGAIAGDGSGAGVDGDSCGQTAGGELVGRPAPGGTTDFGDAAPDRCSYIANCRKQELRKGDRNLAGPESGLPGCGIGGSDVDGVGPGCCCGSGNLPGAGDCHAGRERCGTPGDGARPPRLRSSSRGRSWFPVFPRAGSAW